MVKTNALVNIENHTNVRFMFRALCEAAFIEILKIVKISGESTVSLIIVEIDEMAALCKRYYPKKQVTDVLTFPTNWKSLNKYLKYNLLGDIVIARDKVIEQARQYGHTLRREFVYLFVHGLLHALGFDHDNEVKATAMNALAKRVMNVLGISR